MNESERWTRTELENTLERFYPEDLVALTYPTEQDSSIYLAGAPKDYHQSEETTAPDNKGTG